MTDGSVGLPGQAELPQRAAQVKAWREAGQYPRAEQAARAAIAAVEAAGFGHAAELVALLNELGMIGKYQGRFDEAEVCYRRALAVCRWHHPPGCPQAPAILHNLGGLDHARGAFESALSHARAGIAAREAMIDADPLELAADRGALAAILTDLGRHDEALAMLEAVAACYERTYGTEHHEVAVTLHNLGSLQYRQGLVEAAGGNLHRALKIKIGLLGPRHPDVAVTRYNLACCCRALGDTAAALAHLQDAIGVLDQVVAHDQPTLAACRRLLRELTQ
ncbi:tetratricopeptide repeat protein [Catellatospora methionotrophica]|uniref:tetratricopeptide repeat protein n=1 Tax=Catellatospora methionotrophica TaxID=121620 RepID=UPI0033C0A087